MQSFTSKPRRAAMIAGAAGVAVVAAIGVSAAAFADGTPTASPSASSSAGPVAGPTAGPGGRAHEPHIGGTVLAVSGSTVTVQDRDGFTRTIRVADDATVTDGDDASSLSEVAKGDHVEATGTVDADGTTLDATAVRIGDPVPPKGGPGHEGGPGGRMTDRTGDGQAPTPPTAAPTGAPTPSAS